MQRHGWWLRAAGAVVFGLALVMPASPAAAGDDTVVRTAQGVVRGTAGQGVRQFLGIPYAAPPVGELRWRPPQPAASWEGVRDATAFGSACAQAPGVFAANGGQGSVSEDCLYLNVYTPSSERGQLPVMVWIHGGGFVAGSASQYDARVLSSQGHAVIVTINYRLGPFGFLALPGLSADTSGNFGLEDQQAALRWVRRNIARFGGDPHSVTIFGESAGGLSVCAQLASPSAAGLFQRAITESGPCVASLPTLAAAEAGGSAFAAGLGCPAAAGAAAQVACMRGLPVSTLLAGGGAFAPSVGGAVLPRQLAAAIASGRFNRVPVIEGTNHDEYRLFVAVGFDIPGHPITSQQYPALLQATFGGHAEAVLAEYPLTAYASPGIAFSTVMTDAQFACPALAADALLAAHVRTFAYEFNDRQAPEFLVTDPVMPLGAFHAAELAYVFRLPTLPPGFFTPAQVELSDQMIRFWTRFADEGSPDWPRARPAGGVLESLAPSATAPIPATGFAADHHCAFWSELHIS